MFDQILDLLGQPPGSLVYHFIILFAVEAALAISLGQWMRERDSSTGRLTVAIVTIFGARTLVLVASLLAWRGLLPRNVLLPPVERAVDTLTILGLAWAFATMDDPVILRRNFVADVAAAALSGIIFAGFIGTYYYWLFLASQGQLFNGLWLDVAWSAAQIFLAVAGLIWMLVRVRYVYDPFLKGLMLIILGGAAGLHLVRPVLGDVAAAMRIGQIVAMPMLAAVAYRHVVEQLLHWDEFEPSRAEPVPNATVPRLEPIPAPPETAEETARILKEEPSQAVAVASQPETLEVVEALGGLLGTLEEPEIVREATRVVATALRADMCVLVVVDQEAQQAGIIGGYDNIAQTYLPEAVLELSDHPTIVKALSRLRQMRLTTQRNRSELRDLYDHLQITHEGPAYIQPLVKGEDRIGVLIVGSPYSERQFSNAERDLLDRLGPLVTAALLNAESYQDLKEEVEKARLASDAQLISLTDELTATQTELNEARRQIEEMKAYIRDMHRQLESIPEQQEAAREQIERLRKENEALKQAQAELSRLQAEYERLKAEAARVEELERELQQAREQAEAHNSAMSGPSAQYLLEQQLEEVRLAARSEIASLRARLAQASISQQEVAFLQEQLAAKSREAIELQTRLTEAQAMMDALREQLDSGGASMGRLGSLQERVAAQAAEIASLREELAQLQATASLDAETLQAQQEVEQIDRDAMAQLQAQLAERAELIEMLQTQLAEKNRAIADLRTHMEDVETSLRNLEKQLSHKTEEVKALQASLAETRAQAQERIAALEAELEAGTASVDDIQQARIEALEAELAEKAAAVEALEAQLQRTTQAMAELERQLSATSQAVNAAISDAGRIDSHDEVIASLAQELRTPMSSIMGYTELLLRESVGILGSLQRKFLQRVKANTERMGTLLDDLIRITALDMGQLQLEPEKVDVVYAVEEVITSVASQYREKGLTLRLSIDEDLPLITADRDALLQVLGHLLSNAALASQVEGEVQLLVTRRRDRVPAGGGEEVETECLYIAVEDSGVGVAPEDFERVFLRKYQADSPLIEGLGDTGVGLSLAKTLVDAHGGRIWLESEKGTGTTFHVLLPFDRVQIGDVQQEKAS
ncbi:MAG TPA: hypothetical protein ENI95_01630 [Chloroflexi bacterium]|nr:hypothetical protein [Chloroflexota bacterium]